MILNPANKAPSAAYQWISEGASGSSKGWCYINVATSQKYPTKILHIDALPILALADGSYVAFDTNDLIQLVDEQHEHHRNTVSVIQSIHRKSSATLVFFQPSKLELQEYMRRTLFTKGLIEKCYKQRLVGGAGKADNFINHWVTDNQHQQRSALSDRDIKRLRELCLIDFPAIGGQGINKWKQICRLCLGGLPKIEELFKKWGIRYVGLYDKVLFPEGSTPPRWEDQEKLMTTFGLGSADAAILNMAMSNTKIAGVVTNDGDMVELFKAGVMPEQVHCFTFLRKYVDPCKGRIAG